MMEFDQNIVALIAEINGLSPMAQAEEKAKRLKKCFKQSNEAHHGKMLFFLILHTELEIREKLKNVDAFSFLIDTCRTISLNDLCVIITQLELINALCDIVSTCPAIVSVEILNHLHEVVFQSEKKYEYCIKLAHAVYDKHYKLLLLHHREPDSDCLSNVFLSFLPSTYKSKGYQAMDSVLCEINCQLQIWREVLSRRTIKDVAVFRFCLNNSENCDSICADVEDPIKTVIMEETFSTFISDLKEILEDSRLTDESEMKKMVWNNASSLHEAIKGRNLINPEYEKWMESIEGEEISDCDIFDVIDKISDFETGKKWLKKLINHPKWFEREEAVSVVSNHSKSMDSDDSKRVIDSLRTAEFDEKLMKIYVNCFERISIEDQINLFEIHFEKNRNFNFENSDEELTEKFNKMSESDPKTRTFLITSCIRSPLKTVTELCRLAVSNEGMLRPCVEYLVMLRKACLSGGERSLIAESVNSLLEKGDLTPSEKLLLISLISKLQELKFFDFNFVNFYILKSISIGLTSENFDKVIFSLELLKSCVKLRGVPRSERVVLLAFAVRALSRTSWDCSTFSAELVHARELLIDVIRYLMKSSERFDGVEVAWLRREILRSSELNQLCFCDFLCSRDCSYVDSKDVHFILYGLIHAESKAQSIIDSFAVKIQDKKFLELRAIFVLALIKLLPVLTAEEWTKLFTRLKSVLTAWFNLRVNDREEEVDLVVVDLLTTSMYCLAQDSNQHGDMSSCFEFCVRNYGRVIQKNFLNGGKVGVDVRIDLAKKILFLLNGIEDSSFRISNSLILSSVLLGITNCPSGEGKGLRELGERFRRDFIRR